MKKSREDLAKYFLYFGFTYNINNDKAKTPYYSYKEEDEDGLTLIIFIINRYDEPVFNLAIYKRNIREASFYEDEACDFLNEFFKNERRKLTISNMLDTNNEHSKEI